MKKMGCQALNINHSETINIFCNSIRTRSCKYIRDYATPTHFTGNSVCRKGLDILFSSPPPPLFVAILQRYVAAEKSHNFMW